MEFSRAVRVGPEERLIDKEICRSGHLTTVSVEKVCIHMGLRNRRAIKLVLRVWFF